MARSIFIIKSVNGQYVTDNGVFLLYQDAIEHAMGVRESHGCEVWLEEWLDAQNSGKYKEFLRTIELNKVRPLNAD